MNPLVVGIGNRWRRDDGVGPRAVEALTGRLPADVDLLVLDGEPARLVTAWQDRPWVLVIDAIRTGARPGTISFLDVRSLEGTSRPFPSSHHAGLEAAVALGRALDRLPGQLIAAGIEPSDLDHGDELSEPVATAFEPLLARIEEEVQSLCV